MPPLSSVPHCRSTRILFPGPAPFLHPAQPQPALTRRTISKRHLLYQVAPKKAILIIKLTQSHFQEALRSLALFQGIGGRINVSFKCCTIKPNKFLCDPKVTWRSVTNTKLETSIGSVQVEQMVKIQGRIKENLNTERGFLVSFTIHICIVHIDIRFIAVIQLKLIPSLHYLT